MSLIRNGGFERGNTDFWEVITGGTLEVSSVSPLYGSYCGKFTANSGSGGTILSNDYIDVKPYQIIDGILYIKSTTTEQAYLSMYLYDADYSLIDIQYGSWVTNDGTYIKMNNQFRIPPECAYVRFGVQIHSSTSGDVFYLDGGGLEIINSDSAMSGVVELLPLSDYYASSGTYYLAKSMMQFSTFYAQLRCTFVTGTSPTLDVEVKEVDPFGQNTTLASFTTVTSVTEERIDLPHCLGSNMFLVYTIGGTSPEFDFGVAVVGKR